MQTVTRKLTDRTFSFSAPDDWTLRDTSVSGRINLYFRGPLASDKSFHASIALHIRPRQVDSLSAMASRLTDTRSKMPRFRLLAHTKTNLADLEAIQLDLAHNLLAPLGHPRPSVFAIRERIVLALDDEREYELCYRAARSDFDAHLPVFEALMASFAI